MSRFFCTFVLGFVLLPPATSVVLSGETQNTSFYLHKGVAAIEKALDEPAIIEVDNTTLFKAVRVLGKRCKIQIEIDKSALKEVKITDDTLISKPIHSSSLRMALHELLRPHGLELMIFDGTLMITTAEQAEIQMIVKMYDVSDLVVCRDDKGILWDDYDTLCEVIINTVMPTTWCDVGAPGSIDGASLGKAKIIFVYQTYAAHCELAKLLAQIRKIAEKHSDAQPPLRNRPPYQPKKRYETMSDILSTSISEPVEQKPEHKK